MGVGMRRQSGMGAQGGIGNIFRGSYFQEGGNAPNHLQAGAGLSSILSKVFKTLMPIAKKGLGALSTFLKSDTGQNLKKEAINTALRAGADVLEGKSPKEGLQDSLENVKSEIALGLRKKATSNRKPKKVVAKKRKLKKNISGKAVKRKKFDLFS